ncbi:P-loop containing nucleoside triphosphate hydrolase protein [Hypoxylon sp. NC1633]|nr:P-loop containing nucleoside triphosphate hydrolase protein [Hypoxylon sp. NC1633]
MRVLLRPGSASSSCAFLACRRHAFTTFTPTTRKIRHVDNWLSKSSDENSFSMSNPRIEIPNRAHREAAHTYAIFRRIALSRYDTMMNFIMSWESKEDEYKAFGVNSKLDFDREVKLFRRSIERACDLASETNAISKSENPLFWSLRTGFVDGDMKGLSSELTLGFQNFLMRSRFPKNIASTHRNIADFRYPSEWFPATRAMQRTIHLHVGPTNSGKTYNALKALENAKSGIYAGPLRLLAHEVYTRFIAKGKPCALVTGEEQRIPENVDNYYRSCTVEMTPLNHPVEVAVIDEIQMIGDSDRGWAWTQAFLGVQAKEVHLCGEERAVKLIQSLCAITGDDCVVTRYERLSPLEAMTQSVGSLKYLEKGDAVISFSRIGIHSLKRQIEEATGRRCAMVYGSLPPETRAQQAAYFNEPDNDYDFLVASDAIGMGLNLEIKRVIFEQTHKHTKSGFRPMSTSEVKQIGGRAGRYRTARQATGSEPDADPDGERKTHRRSDQPGLVTAMDKDDLRIVREAFTREPEPLMSAGIQAPPSVIERFSSYFPPNTPFSYILSRLRDIARTSPMFHLCLLDEMLEVANLIQPFPMSVYDRCVFLNAPVFLRERSAAQVTQAFARCISEMEGGHLIDIPEVDLELLDGGEEDFQDDPPEYLRRLEALHKTITLYLWLSYRFSGVFHSQTLAFHVKELVEVRINAHLGKLTISESARRSRLKAIRANATRYQLNKEKLLGEDVPIEGPRSELSSKWNEEGHEEPLFDDPKELAPITRLERIERDPTSSRNKKNQEGLRTS